MDYGQDSLAHSLVVNSGVPTGDVYQEWKDLSMLRDEVEPGSEVGVEILGRLHQIESRATPDTVTLWLDYEDEPWVDLRPETC